MTEPSTPQTTASPPADNTLWQFSLAAYRRPGAPQCCLALQNRAGADVNMLLCCVWLAAQGKRLDDSWMKDALAAIGPWRAATVHTLRRACQAMKGLIDDLPEGWRDEARALRQSIKDDELRAEKIQQALLCQLGDRLGCGKGLDINEPNAVRALARHNLDIYARADGLALTGGAASLAEFVDILLD